MSKGSRKRAAARLGLIVLAILTALYFFDIKFMVLGLNIIGWDALAAAVFGLTALWRWAGGSGGRCLAAAGLTVAGMFGAAILLFGLAMYGAIDYYIEEKEPETGRVFVVEYRENMTQQGSARLYERFGPLLLPCDVEEYVGNISLGDEPRAFISDDGQRILVSYFFLRPNFSVPLE